MYIAEKIDREGRGHMPLPREGQDDMLSILTWIETALGKWREYVPEREGDKYAASGRADSRDPKFGRAVPALAIHPSKKVIQANCTETFWI